MEKTRKLTKLDFLLLGILTFLYAILSFYHLGSFDNPNTFLSSKNVLLELESVEEIQKIRYFTGHEMGTVKISISEDGKHYTYLDPIQDVYVFTWNDREVNKKMKYINLEIDKSSHLGEIAFYDMNNQIVKIKSSKENLKLIDEEKTIPSEISYFNSAYFDEIYFARTAYEYANHLPAYEWVHPPLGKLLMALPIRLFKMAPFYYRLMGNIAGILMVPIFYLFAKRLFKKTKYALLAGIFISMDGFHFAHTRMATVDSFLVLFILLAFFFLYEYFISLNVTFKKKLFLLFLSGFFMGCAISVKWTALFAALGLAILFFLHFFSTYFKNKKLEKEGIYILGFCVLFFVFLPLFLYFSLYLCFPNMKYFQTKDIKGIFEITSQMYHYHSTLKESHPFYSSFFTWPFMLHPVWYYAKVVGISKWTISGFGNPILWWFSTFSIFYLFYKCFKKDKNALFLLLAYLCMFLPYFRITRGMFLYHYFPSLVFSFLAFVLFVHDICEKRKNNYFYLATLVLVCFFFVYFFPIVSGTKSIVSHIEALKWLSSWHF